MNVYIKNGSSFDFVYDFLKMLKLADCHFGTPLALVFSQFSQLQRTGDMG